MLAVGNWFFMLQHNNDWSQEYINIQCLNLMQYVSNILLGAGHPPPKGKAKGWGKKGKGKGKKGKGQGNDDTDEESGDSDEDPADLEDIGASNRKGPPPPPGGPGGASSKRKLIC